MGTSNSERVGFASGSVRPPAAMNVGPHVNAPRVVAYLYASQVHLNTPKVAAQAAAPGAPSASGADGATRSSAGAAADPRRHR